MKEQCLTFEQPARRVYSGVKSAIRKCGLFDHIKEYEERFRIEASHGWPIFGENVDIHIVAIGTRVSKVVIQSSDKFLYNIFKWGNNIRNVNDLSDFIRNEIFRYCSEEEIKLTEPNIKFRV